MRHLLVISLLCIMGLDESLALSFTEGKTCDHLLQGDDREQLAHKNLVAAVSKKMRDLQPKQIEILHNIAKAPDNYQEAELLSEFINNTPVRTLGTYLDAIAHSQVSYADFFQLIIDPIMEKNLPPLANVKEVKYLIDAITGTLSSDVKYFAHFNHQRLRRHHFQLAHYLKSIEKTVSEEIRIETNTGGDASILWYPRYPSGVSLTHMKVIVDGEVWGTMERYEKIDKTPATFRRSARIKKRHGFVEFALHLSPEEINRIKYLINTNDRRGTGLGGCVQGACAPFRRAGRLTVPFPFNQIPSLAALYLALRAQFPGGPEISLHLNRQPFPFSILTLDVLFDGAVAAIIPIYCLSMVLGSGYGLGLMP